MPRTCENFGVFGCCNQLVMYKADKTKTERVEWMTGRKLPWSDVDEIIVEPRHPLIPEKLCYYHLKKFDR